MPDLAFSNAGNIVNNWTVQKLVNTTTQNLGYDMKAPAKAEAPEEEKADNGE
jgi:hypothetical protein